MSLDASKELEKTISGLLNNAKRVGVARVISSYDIDAVVAAGIVIRCLMQNDVGFEYLALPNGSSYRVLDEVPNIIIDVEVEGPSGRIGVNRSSTSLSKVGNNSISISSPYYSQTMMKALENLMVITNDVRYYTLAVTLSRSIPRVRVKHVDSSIKNLITELSDMNLIRVVRGIKIFNYSASSLDIALSSSLDLFIPGYSGMELTKDLRVIAEEELIKDIVMKLEATVQVKLTPNDLYGDVYLIHQEWFFRDVFELLYALLTFLDLYGAEYVILSVLVSNYASLLKQTYRKAFKDVAGKAYDILSNKNIQRVKQGVYKVRLDGLSPLTPLNKIIKSYLLPINALIVYEVNDNYYAPASEVTDIRMVIRGNYELVGGILKFKELK